MFSSFSFLCVGMSNQCFSCQHVCECDSEALCCRVVCLSIVCEQKLKTKTSLGENDNDSEAGGAPHESVYSH